LAPVPDRRHEERNAIHGSLRARFPGAPGRVAAGRRRPGRAVQGCHRGQWRQVTKTENWGLKSLAYRIKKNRKAYYALLNIDAPPAAIAELERQQSINEDILRVLTLRVEELEEGPSAQLRKREDDDRGERRGPGGAPRGDRGERRPRREEGRVEGETE
jgi:SSU ribosomal protein S6P